MLVFSAHALNMLRERNIERSWVQRTVDEPDSVEPDAVYPERTRAFRALPERDGRSLRVVYARQQDDVRIITVFLDRGRRRTR